MTLLRAGPARKSIAAIEGIATKKGGPKTALSLSTSLRRLVRYPI
jgi:hypothetical protein